jgi:Family of unknown function (DUF5678)
MDFATILKDATPGEFVAVSKNKIVGSGKTREEATEAAKNNGESDPLVFKVPPPCALIPLIFIS